MKDDLQMFPTSLAERNICASLRFRFKEISEKYYISSVWRIVLYRPGSGVFAI